MEYPELKEYRKGGSKQKNKLMSNTELEGVNRMSDLYIQLDTLDVLERLPDSSYDFIYLDPPYFIGYEVSWKEMKADRDRLEKEELKQYSSYIAKIIENAYRLIKSDGVVAFLSPGQEYADINYRLMMDQFFKSSKIITIERRVRHTSAAVNRNNDYRLYFYAKSKNYNFPELKELRPVEEFPEKDDFDCFRKISAFRIGQIIPNFIYEWKGITPDGNKCWRYNKDRMNQLYDEGRIIIEDNRVWVKQYRTEHPEAVSTVWKEDDTTRFKTFIDTQSLNRMFTMFAGKDAKVLCPFDRDGKFPMIADLQGIEWTAIHCVWDESRDLISEIPANHYTIVDKLQGEKIKRKYKDDIVSNVNDIEELKEQIDRLSDDVRRIKLSIGIENNTEVSVDAVIDKIHERITDTLSSFSLEGCIPEAEEWIRPYWDSLEPESKHFIPTGLLLYNQFGGQPGVDMAPIMIEYCKSFEKELFKKMFFGYVENIIADNRNIRQEFPEAFQRRNTSVFAEFIENCTTMYREQPSEWKFEMGKMAYVLRSALARNPGENIIIDFRTYLNGIFEQQFFRERFMEQLNIVTNIRNSCAHPSIIDNSSVEEGKEIIRQKLLLLLRYYIH